MPNLTHPLTGRMTPQRAEALAEIAADLRRLAGSVGRASDADLLTPDESYSFGLMRSAGLDCLSGWAGVIREAEEGVAHPCHVVTHIVIGEEE